MKPQGVKPGTKRGKYKKNTKSKILGMKNIEFLEFMKTKMNIGAYSEEVKEAFQSKMSQVIDNARNGVILEDIEDEATK